MKKLLAMSLLITACGDGRPQEKQIECCESKVVTIPAPTPVPTPTPVEPKEPENQPCEQQQQQQPVNNININIDIDGNEKATRTDEHGCKSEYKFVRGSFTRFSRCGKKTCESFGHYEIIKSHRKLMYDHNQCDDTSTEVLAI